MSKIYWNTSGLMEHCGKECDKCDQKKNTHTHGFFNGQCFIVMSKTNTSFCKYCSAQYNNGFYHQPPKKVVDETKIKTNSETSKRCLTPAEQMNKLMGLVDVGYHNGGKIQ